MWIICLWQSLLAILDTKPLTSGSLPPAECARPRLHEFLEAIYPHYDSECQVTFQGRLRLNNPGMKSASGMTILSKGPRLRLRFRSQTSWIWLETKLVELGMVGSNRNYQVGVTSISFSMAETSQTTLQDLLWWAKKRTANGLLTRVVVLDKTCMFPVFTERDGKPWSHSVKALQIIWNHFSQLYV